MQYCDHCKVQINGAHLVCPLCGGIIEQKESAKEEEVFPQIPTIYQEFNVFIRVLLFISIAVTVISFAVNMIFTRESRWSILVAAGILCMWISLFFIIRKRNNIPKTIVWQVGLLGVLSVLWDASMGWIGWSIDYVIPSICGSNDCYGCSREDTKDRGKGSDHIFSGRWNLWFYPDHIYPVWMAERYLSFGNLRGGKCNQPVGFNDIRRR